MFDVSKLENDKETFDAVQVLIKDLKKWSSNFVDPRGGYLTWCDDCGYGKKGSNRKVFDCSGCGRELL